MATKKLKKAATPVDQRETFVSLQQSFAENGVDVKEKIKTLYDLQKADSEIDKILQLRGELPTEVKALEDEVEGIKARIEKVNAEVQQMTDSINHEKENIVDCDNQIAKYQKQLDDIANSREYDSINKEIENETLLRQIAEKNIKDARMKIAESHDKTNALKDQLTVSEDSLAAKHKELDNIVESTAKEEARLRAIREKCAEKIDERTMSAYERIRASVKNHLAVVTVYNGDSCGGCFNVIPPQRLVDINDGDKLMICENCGRIIVSKALAEGEE